MFRRVKYFMNKLLIIKNHFHSIKSACLLLLMLSALTGFIYPIIITGLARILFPVQSNGSLIINDKKIIGSELIGQYFQNPKYFWSRPSATTPYPNNAKASASSNLAPFNPKLVLQIKEQIKKLLKVDPSNINPIPIDLVTTSGSGLDPHITPIAAFYQVSRIAKTRNLSDEKIRRLIDKWIEKPQLGFLGQPRVNVLKLNLALDGLI